MKVPGKWLVNNDPDQAGVWGLVACCLWFLASVWPHQQEPWALAEDGLTADFSLRFWLGGTGEGFFVSL